MAVGSVDFAAKATAGDTIVVNCTVFEFQAGASEAAGTSAGTVADPHLITLGADLAATNTAFAVALLAEDETTGAWGVIYPDDSVGVVDDTTSKTTISFWPGTWANSLTMFDVSGLTAAPTVVQPGTASLGVDAPSLLSDYSVNLIDAANHNFGLTDAAKEFFGQALVPMGSPSNNDIGAVQAQGGSWPRIQIGMSGGIRG